MIRVVAMSACLAMGLAGQVIAQSAAVAADAAKPDPVKGRAIASQLCVACHMADGNSAQPANPRLAGQFPEYLHKQLTNFKPQGKKKPERASAIMAGMVAALSDADMRNVAAFYASQTLRPAAARDKDRAAQGQKIFRGGNPANGVPACAGCHGPTGAGIPDQFPRIGGQFPEYIEAQLMAFRSGARANDPNGMMRGVTARMTDAEIKAVAEYAAGLR